MWELGMNSNHLQELQVLSITESYLSSSTDFKMGQSDDSHSIEATVQILTFDLG